MPVAAPISGVETNFWPWSDWSNAASGVLRNAGSAEVSAMLRCEARGAAIACGRVMPKSTSLTMICSTVVIIVDPPGEPRAGMGSPTLLVTIVGLMLLLGRLPPSGELASSGIGSKSVSSLLRRKPWSGTVMALPPVCSMVKV
jgi:hypothetical protein